MFKAKPEDLKMDDYVSWGTSASDARGKIVDIKGKELLIELGKRWQILKKNNDKRLQSYQKLAEQDKERYTNEKNSFPDGKEVEVEVEEEVVVEEKPKKQQKKKESVKKEPVVVEPVVVEPVVVVEEKKKVKKNAKK